ncbi:MAG: PAS domain-containing protein [Planctomycetes bacterium]|nr:PAS domain-containing protein [Planctomycetota bacterium]
MTAEQMKEDFNLAWSPIIEEDEPDMAESIRVSAATLQPWSQEFRIRTPSGRIKWLSGRSRPEPPDADDTIVWNGILTDISEKKRVEQALRDSIDRFSLVARGATDGIWEMTFSREAPWDSSQTKVYHSPRVKELLGYDDHEEMDTVDSWTRRLHPDDAQRTTKAVQDHLEQRVPYQVEYRLMTRSGQYRWFHGSRPSSLGRTKSTSPDGGFDYRHHEAKRGGRTPAPSGSRIRQHV